jgi:hypothetical protein
VNSNPPLLAQGPDSLYAVLEGLLKRTQADPHSTTEGRCILYKLGSQKSLIKVDTSRRPFELWYCDLLGRPATKAVRDTIAQFLWEKCGEKERHGGSNHREYIETMTFKQWLASAFKRHFHDLYEQNRGRLVHHTQIHAQDCCPDAPDDEQLERARKHIEEMQAQRQTIDSREVEAVPVGNWRKFISAKLKLMLFGASERNRITKANAVSKSTEIFTKKW